MRILLLTPARRFIANRAGLGYQIPYGLVCLGGPLVDDGHTVRLLDNDVHGYSDERLVEEARAFGAELIMIGHTGSTAAHLVSIATATVLKRGLPTTPIVYGGVYPSYAAEQVLAECSAIDIVVRGEGEETALRLASALSRGDDLENVPAIAYRGKDGVRVTHLQPPTTDLDRYRPGWELVEWDRYELYGLGRSAGFQFSRGCPLTCTYCGQWLFWRKWRHRSPAAFVEQLRELKQRWGVNVVWLADENFAADPALTLDVLERLVAADLGLSLNVNMTAADVVRDADRLPLYKAAGVDYVVMGIEAVDDDVVSAIRKNNPFEISGQAIALLRQHHIVSLANIIYGLGDETAASMKWKHRQIVRLDPDILNAVYLTPHFWTQEGKEVDPANVIQTDLGLWTYRNQVIHTPHLSPTQLFLRIKATELAYHLRPRALARLFFGGDARIRGILRQQMLVGARVFIAELVEFLRTRFAPLGTLRRLPGAPEKPKRIGSAPGVVSLRLHGS